MEINVFEVVPDVYRLSVAPTPRFEFNHFLIVDEKPTLVHTGRVAWFGRLRDEVAQLVDPRDLAYVAFSHFEADECGALNHWLLAAPNAVHLVNDVGRASLEDFASRPARVVADGEYLDLGRRRLQILETPHFPHNWDAMLFWDCEDGILFSSDLGAQPGAGVPATEADVSEQMVTFQRRVGFMAEGRDLYRAITRLEALDIRYLATQHGPTIVGPAIRSILTRLKAEFGTL